MSDQGNPEDAKSAPADTEANHQTDRSGSNTKTGADAAENSKEASEARESAGNKSNASENKEPVKESKDKSQSEDAPKSKEPKSDEAAKSTEKSEDAPKSKNKSDNDSKPKKHKPKSKSKPGSSSTASASKSNHDSEANPGSGVETKSGDGSMAKGSQVSKSSRKSHKSKSKSKVNSKSKLSSTQDEKGKSETKSENASATKGSQMSKSSNHKIKSKHHKSKSKSKESKTGDKPKSKSKDKSKSKEDSPAGHKSKNKLVKSKTSKQSTKDANKNRKHSKSSDKMKKHVDLSGAKVGFVGAGKMTSAIVRGLLNCAQVKPKKIFVAGKTSRNLDPFKTNGITVTTRAYDIFGQYDCDIVFLCMHGYVIRACFKAGGTRPLAFTVNYIPNQKHPLYVLSLIGGVSLTDIKLTLLDPDNPEKYLLIMHRVMLNIGVGYGLGMAVLDVEVDSDRCTSVVRDVLSSLVKEKNVDHFDEHMMDTACVIGGNGLAFCYYFISAIAEGGFKMGLNKVMAIRMAAKSLQIAAQSVIETGKHPSQLQDSIIASGGPSIYGIHALEKVDCAGGFQSAIEGAYRRLKELVNIEPVTETEAKPF